MSSLSSGSLPASTPSLSFAMPSSSTMPSSPAASSSSTPSPSKRKAAENPLTLHPLLLSIRLRICLPKEYGNEENGEPFLNPNEERNTPERNSQLPECKNNPPDPPKRDNLALESANLRPEHINLPENPHSDGKPLIMKEHFPDFEPLSFHSVQKHIPISLEPNQS
ncbi:hypothetical protein BT96DRAFT_1004213 [Gymnopus androsaceus JB14]|uniref:Uncharacterized protein n=1 Tax=Gymnopus androsaceus JB14 TaxID=1447944 RepID=A0A6A4GRY2_9AGAR|nr:hypothetical protein BT96DRAFT_1004213 [Gymnopus androsaceus JB14]